MTDEELTPEQAAAAGLIVSDGVIGDPPPYDYEAALKLSKEGDPLMFEEDPDC